tara:strand:- start:1290 stop:1589 length:300 start_codon:yes stop_codon:yes gene_type:complete
LNLIERIAATARLKKVESYDDHGVFFLMSFGLVSSAIAAWHGNLLAKVWPLAVDATNQAPFVLESFLAWSFLAIIFGLSCWFGGAAARCGSVLYKRFFP